MRHINFPFILAALVGLILLAGHVYQNIWEWFIVPLGVPSLTLPHALGILLLGGFHLRAIARQKLYEEKTGYSKSWALTAYGYMSVLSFWGLAYLYTLFM